MFPTAFRGEGKERHGRLGVQQRSRALGGGNGDIRQLARCGLDHDPAVGECEQSLVPEIPIVYRHDKHAGHQADPRFHPHGVKRGANGLGGCVRGAADAAIGVSGCHHQVGEIQRPPRDRACLHLRDPLRATPLVVKRGVFGSRRRCLGIDERHALGSGAGTPGDQDRLEDSALS